MFRLILTQIKYHCDGNNNTKFIIERREEIYDGDEQIDNGGSQRKQKHLQERVDTFRASVHHS